MERATTSSTLYLKAVSSGHHLGSAESSLTAPHAKKKRKKRSRNSHRVRGAVVEGSSARGSERSELSRRSVSLRGCVSGWAG